MGETSVQIKIHEKHIKWCEKHGYPTDIEKTLVKSWKRWLGKHPEDMLDALQSSYGVL